MIVGNKAKFAVELLFDEFYDNNFIASGAYRIFLNGFPYGYEYPYSTLYGGIVFGLKNLLTENIMRKNFFHKYSDYEIAVNYQKATYEDSDNDAIGKTYLGIDKKNFINSFFDLRDYSESAFDDGSFMLLFRNEAFVKLIGFQMTIETREIINVNSIIMSRKKFDNIIKRTLKTILSERSKNKKK
ncbi:hypothetical protein [Treponema pedis]|uniref:hypothetical protein n=1 Tax=Treponema pedis TaxID=409322 RepID=UPI000429AFFF|nr:hypothetical protein [Treponema pedis]